MTRTMLFTGLMLAAFSTATGANAADTVGVAACDEFLTKYEACISAKVPAAQQSAMKASFDQTRSTWATMARDANQKPALEAACKSTGEQMKTALSAYGCSF